MRPLPKHLACYANCARKGTAGKCATQRLGLGGNHLLSQANICFSVPSGKLLANFQTTGAELLRHALRAKTKPKGHCPRAFLLDQGCVLNESRA